MTTPAPMSYIECDIPAGRTIKQHCALTRPAKRRKWWQKW